MVVLSDGTRLFNFYGKRETLNDCFERGFRVCLYERGHQEIRLLKGMFIVREEVI